MRPYYEHAGITIYHGDCREILPELSGDALVTDPPYGIGWSRATWNDAPEDYPTLIRWLVDQGVRIGGWCFIFQAMSNVSRFHEWFPPGWRVFAACKNFAQIRPTGVWYSWDPVVFWNSGPATKYTGDGVNRDFHVGNVSGALSHGNSHPTPRPLDTMRHIVALAASSGKVVVDPFLGSGTTAVAAKALDRRCIGIEIEERYCEIAAKRLEQDALPYSGAPHVAGRL